MIGEILKKTREVYGFSIAELARESGVSAAKIKAQEAGRADLGIEELFKIDRIFDNDIVWELVNAYDSLSR